MNETPFVIERSYPAPVQEVWDAITDRAKMKAWYFDLSEFKAEVGFEFSFVGGDSEHQYVHRCKVVKVIPMKLLAYTWAYDSLPGSSTVTFELFAEENGTRLRLTHEGLESFVTDDKNFRRESFANGWTYILGESLARYFNK